METEGIASQSEQASHEYLVPLFNRFESIAQHCQSYKHSLTWAVFRWDCNSYVAKQFAISSKSLHQGIVMRLFVD